MDRRAIEDLGIPGIRLMETAGAAAFKALRQRWPAARFVSVVAGGGNNGGDGYVIARLALEAGIDVRVYAVTPPSALGGDARLAYEAYAEAGGSWLDYVPARLESAEVVVDALFGTGLNREVSDGAAAVIHAVNGCSAGILSVDVPSGLNADTGQVMGIAIEADLTVSFVGLKTGLFTGAGPAHCGEIEFDDLDLPDTVRHGTRPVAELLPVATNLPRRRRDAHKGDFGHVLVIGGDLGYSGAVRLAAEAAARVGAGLVSVATHPEHATVLNLARPELMCRGIVETDDLDALLRRATIVAVGPGLGRRDWGRMLLDAAIRSGLPLIVDADGLNLLAAAPRPHDRWILTPHPGEAARLLGVTSSEINADRYQAARRLQQSFGGTIVLKGAGSLLAGPDGALRVGTGGNPGLASGGSGDVLTGVIAGLAAQGLSLPDAAAIGVQLHAAAGDLAAADGERGLLAGDLMAPLRRLVNFGH